MIACSHYCDGTLCAAAAKPKPDQHAACSPLPTNNWASACRLDDNPLDRLIWRALHPQAAEDSPPLSGGQVESSRLKVETRKAMQKACGSPGRVYLAGVTCGSRRRTSITSSKKS